LGSQCGRPAVLTERLTPSLVGGGYRPTTIFVAVIVPAKINRVELQVMRRSRRPIWTLGDESSLSAALSFVVGVTIVGVIFDYVRP